MKTLQKKHPLAIRWFHWINFPLLAVMVWSGTLIYWANAVYRVGLGQHTLFRMTFSNATWNKLHVSYRLAEGMALHFFFMWLFAINGVLYVVYTIASGEWRELVPDRRSFKEAIQATLHDLGRPIAKRFGARRWRSRHSSPSRSGASRGEACHSRSSRSS